jgi:hypothetical protein
MLMANRGEFGVKRGKSVFYQGELLPELCRIDKQNNITNHPASYGHSLYCCVIDLIFKGLIQAPAAPAQIPFLCVIISNEKPIDIIYCWGFISWLEKMGKDRHESTARLERTLRHTMTG